MKDFKKYDLISFDIFDTLIFRRCHHPKDLFYKLDKAFNYPQIHTIRIAAEQELRIKKLASGHGTEVTLQEIWEEIQCRTGICAKQGIRIEKHLENKFCYANYRIKPFFEAAISSGVAVVITSDMYLDSKFLENLLIKNGICGFQKIYVSCEYKKSKATGALYSILKNDCKQHARILHIGDNYWSDTVTARLQGIDPLFYRRNKNGASSKIW